MAENDNQSPVKIELPSDVEAEKAVLGSMMKSSDAVSDVIDLVKPEDFQGASGNLCCHGRHVPAQRQHRYYNSSFRA